jgi:hypothetical protein
MKGVCRFGIKGKLAPCYIGPYPILDKYGPMSYQVELPTKLSGFIMCCMSPNSRDVWSLWQTWLLKTPSHWNLIWRTRHIPSRSSTNKTESHAIRLLSSTRSNEMSTPKKKPRGNVRPSYEPTTPTSFHRGNRPPPISFMHSFQSRDEIFFKGGGL